MRELAYLNKGISIVMEDRRQKDEKEIYLRDLSLQEGLKEFITF